MCAIAALSGLGVWLAAFPALAQSAAQNDYDECSMYATAQSQQYFALYSYSDKDKELIVEELFGNCMRGRGHETTNVPLLTGEKLQSFLDSSM